MKKNVIISTLALCILAIIPGWGQTSVIKRGNFQQPVSKKPAIRWADKASSYSEGLCWVKDKNGKYGYVDEKGKLVIPCKWVDVRDFSEGLARVRDDSHKLGFIDKTGRTVIPCKWKGASSFQEGYAWVKADDDKYGFIDKTGALVSSCQWEKVEEFSEGLACVKDENK
jgi:hypothetical protein